MNDEVEKEEPLDPAVEAVRVKMVRLLAVSGGIMVIGLMAVVGAIVYKINQEPAASVLPVSPLAGEVKIPKGSEIMFTDVTTAGLVLTLRLSDGKMIIRNYDPRGRLRAQYAVIEE